MSLQLLENIREEILYLSTKKSLHEENELLLQAYMLKFDHPFLNKKINISLEMDQKIMEIYKHGRK